MVGLHVSEDQVSVHSNTAGSGGQRCVYSVCACVRVVLHLRTYIQFPSSHCMLLCAQLKSIAKRTMREADKDKDDKISLQEFKAVSCFYENAMLCKMHKYTLQIKSQSM